MQINWRFLSAEILQGKTVSRDKALEILQSSDDELLDLLAAAFEIRRHYFGRGVRLHLLRNAQSGNCTEDCAYCSQSSLADPSAEVYPLQTAEEILRGAAEAVKVKALRYCVVASGRSPTEQVMDVMCSATGKIKQLYPGLQVCVSLGILNKALAKRLKDAGVNRYNHNLETS